MNRHTIYAQFRTHIDIYRDLRISILTLQSAGEGDDSETSVAAAEKLLPQFSRGEILFFRRQFDAFDTVREGIISFGELRIAQLHYVARVTRESSLVTRHTSHVTRHTSHVTRHIF